jgi:hypothetical protein
VPAHCQPLQTHANPLRAALRYSQSAWAGLGMGWAALLELHTVVSDCLRFLLIILGRNGSGNDYFWLKTDRLQKYFRPKEAQTGLKLDKPGKNVAKTIIFLIVLAETDFFKTIISPAETKAIRHYGNTF